jgi:sulfite reductase (NADPH) flavoprotein alpha-component
LRSLLKQRQRQGRADNWLIFGERCEHHDRWLAEELDGWAESGSLLLDRCFSRQHPSGEYVQQRLAGKADQLRTWVDRGATIHVCGSLENLGQSVQQTLEQLLSAQQWQSLQQHDRYRRDLY